MGHASDQIVAIVIKDIVEQHALYVSYSNNVFQYQDI